MRLQQSSRTWTIVAFSAIISLIIVLLAWPNDERRSISSEQLAGCAWFTACWHDDYYEEFVRDGLVSGGQSEGDFLGVLAYRVQAITTQDLFTFLSILFSVLVFLGGLQFGRLQHRRAYTVETIMGIFQRKRLRRPISKCLKLT
jgi:uncharacterized membrane protein